MNWRISIGVMDIVLKELVILARNTLSSFTLYWPKYFD